MKTVVINTSAIKRTWHLIDANGLVLGRLASQAATLLTGKRKRAFSPNQDHGDHVIVINAGKVRLTGKKADMKTYFSHSTKPGRERIRTYKSVLQADSRKVIRHAVHGMVPKSALGRKMLKRLHVYPDAQHPHTGVTLEK